MFIFRLKRCWDRGVLVEARPRLDRDRASWVIHWSNVTMGASPVAQQERIHLLMQEIWVQSLGWEYHLKKEMATHSSMLAWGILWTEEPGREALWGWKSDTTEQLNWTERIIFNLISQATEAINKADRSGIDIFFVVIKSLSCIWLFCNPMYCNPPSSFCPWSFLGKNTGMGCHFLLQGVFLTQVLNPRLLYWQVDSLPVSHQASPRQLLDIY